jgi:lactose/L-arabinose transport system ATP-binding protein
VLRAGRIEQVGSPLELYDDPDNAFVAGFIGSPRMNFLSGRTLPGGRFAVGGVEVDVPLSVSPVAGSEVQVGIRPEHLDEEAGVALPLKVEVVEQLGSTAYVHGVLPTGETVIAERRSGQPKVGETIEVRFEAAKVRVFVADGARVR